MEDHITDSQYQEPDDLIDDYQERKDYEENQADLWYTDGERWKRPRTEEEWRDWQDELKREGDDQ